MPLSWLAQAHAMLGQRSEARDCLDEAVQIVETTDERVSEAELLHRVPGDLLNAAGDRAGAERHYLQAVAVAERQSAKLFSYGCGKRRIQLDHAAPRFDPRA